MTVRFKPSYQLDHDLRTNDEFIAMLVSFAEPIAAAARAIAPVGPTSHPDDESEGAYRDSIGVVIRVGTTGRKRVAVVAENWKAVWIEFGTAKWPAHATLRKAARQAVGAGKRGVGGGKRIGAVRNSKYVRTLSRARREAGLPTGGGASKK